MSDNFSNLDAADLTKVRGVTVNDVSSSDSIINWLKETINTGPDFAGRTLLRSYNRRFGASSQELPVAALPGLMPGQVNISGNYGDGTFHEFAMNQPVVPWFYDHPWATGTGEAWTYNGEINKYSVYDAAAFDNATSDTNNLQWKIASGSNGFGVVSECIFTEPGILTVFYAYTEDYGVTWSEKLTLTTGLSGAGFHYVAISPDNLTIYFCYRKVATTYVSKITRDNTGVWSSPIEVYTYTSPEGYTDGMRDNWPVQETHYAAGLIALDDSFALMLIKPHQYWFGTFYEYEMVGQLSITIPIGIMGFDASLYGNADNWGCCVIYNAHATLGDSADHMQDVYINGTLCLSKKIGEGLFVTMRPTKNIHTDNNGNWVVPITRYYDETHAICVSDDNGATWTEYDITSLVDVYGQFWSAAIAGNKVYIYGNSWHDEGFYDGPQRFFEVVIDKENSSVTSTDLTNANMTVIRQRLAEPPVSIFL